MANLLQELKSHAGFPGTMFNLLEQFEARIKALEEAHQARKTELTSVGVSVNTDPLVAPAETPQG